MEDVRVRGLVLVGGITGEGGLIGDVAQGFGEAQADHVEDLDGDPDLAVSEQNFSVADDLDVLVLRLGGRFGGRVETDCAFGRHLWWFSQGRIFDRQWIDEREVSYRRIV